jgi:hypothetical protein
MTTGTSAIQVGSLAIATRASGVSNVGERGVCYEVYTLGGRPGYSFIFEKGHYDGFRPEDVALFLTITGEVCTAVADYQFINVTRLSRDFAQGWFVPAFPPRLLAPLQNNAAEDARREQARAVDTHLRQKGML